MALIGLLPIYLDREERGEALAEALPPLLYLEGSLILRRLPGLVTDG